MAGHDLERAVGVPEAIADGEQPPPVIACERLVVLVEIGHVREGRWQAMILGRAQAGADRVLDVAETLREGELLLVVDVLVVKDQHRVLVHAGVDGVGIGLGQRLRYVDAVDLACEAGADLADRDGHLLGLPIGLTFNPRTLGWVSPGLDHHSFDGIACAIHLEPQSCSSLVCTQLTHWVLSTHT